MNDCIELNPHSGFFPSALGVIAKIQRIPLKAQFELTARCNFNCRMCYIHMNNEQIKKIGRELTTPEWLHIASELKDMGTLYLSLTGGEVFTRPDFRELYERLSEMGFLIQIMSNISMIDEHVIRWLSESPPYNISTTIYGSNNNVYKAVTGIANGFELFDKALNLLLDNNIPVSIKSTVSRLNENDLGNMYKYCARRGIKLIASYGINKPVRGASSDAEKVRRLRYQPPSAPPVSPLLKRDGHGPYQHHKYYLDDCGAYGNSILITWDGHITLCSYMAEPFIDLKSSSVKDAWPAFLKQIDKIQKPDRCNNCKYEEYCTRCPGSLAAECGSYDTVTDDYCKSAKYLYSLYNNGEDNGQ